MTIIHRPESPTLHVAPPQPAHPHTSHPPLPIQKLSDMTVQNPYAQSEIARKKKHHSTDNRQEMELTRNHRET
jgi:hypothetical protein